jgi:ADP-ribosylglycohydrolase
MRTHGRIIGCLLGLAIGDALGAPVEFLQLYGIKAEYGEAGIQDLDEWRGLPAGAILGAKLGAEAIPEEWIARLENNAMISELAQAMYSCFGGVGR